MHARVLWQTILPSRIVVERHRHLAVFRGDQLAVWVGVVIDEVNEWHHPRLDLLSVPDVEASAQDHGIGPKERSRQAALVVRVPPAGCKEKGVTKWAAMGPLSGHAGAPKISMLPPHQHVQRRVVLYFHIHREIN